MADRVGQQLGHYRLVRLVGRGAFAEVYLGEQVHLGSQAAIKILRAHLASPEELDEFRAEARKLIDLAHPHLIRLLDFGTEEGTPYLVTSYAPNGTLRQRHQRGTQLALPTLISYVQQIADGLSYAHKYRLIHRDIKPENLLLGQHQEVLISDFGVAVIASTRADGLQNVAGTVSYMAPEQLQGKPQRASDQYALGILVYEWLTGMVPFHGSWLEIASQHALKPPPPLREQRANLSPRVETVVLKALEKDPGARFASVAAFAQALEEACYEDLSWAAAPVIGSAFASLSSEPGNANAAPPQAALQEGRPPVPDLLAARDPAQTRLLPTEVASSPPTALAEAALQARSAASPVPLPGRSEAGDTEPPRSNQPTEILSGDHLISAEATTMPGTFKALPTTLPGKRRQPGLRLLLAGLVVIFLVGGIGVVSLTGQGPLSWLRGNTPVPTSAGASSTGGPRGATATASSAAFAVTKFPLPAHPGKDSPYALTSGPDGNLWFTLTTSGASTSADALAMGDIGRLELTTGRITLFPLANRPFTAWGITSGPDGNLWFTEQSDHIGRITPTGEITEFSLSANTDPRGIILGPDGNLWFTAFESQRIGRITPNGVVSEFTLPRASYDPRDPWGLTVGPDGNLWFTEYTADQIGRITPDGAMTLFPLPSAQQAPVSYPSAITTGADSNLWFTEERSHKIGRITPSGEITEFDLPGPRALAGITSGPDGNLWFAEGGHASTVGRITPGGDITEFDLPELALHPFFGPEGITLGPDGNLWFTEADGIGRLTLPTASLRPSKNGSGPQHRALGQRLRRLQSRTVPGRESTQADLAAERQKAWF